MILNDALFNEDEIKKLYEYSLLIDSQKTRKFDDFISQVTKTKNNLFELKQKNPVSVFTDGDYTEQIKSIICNILTENGFVISKKANYKVSANTICLISRRITEQDEIFSCSPTISVLVEGKSGTVSSCVIPVDEISSYDKQDLIERTKNKISNSLNEKIIQSLLK